MRSPDRTSPLVRILRRTDAVVEIIERLVLTAGILLMAGITIANVIARNVFLHSLSFADELNQILIVLITFVGIGYGVRHARHIRMAALHDQLGPRGRKWLIMVVSVGTAALLFALTWYSVRYVVRMHTLGSVTPALQIPLWTIYAWAPVGLFIGGIHYSLAALRNLTSTEVYLSFTRKDEYDEGPPGV